MKKPIQVTEYDIARGKRASCDACPVAHAIERECDSFFAVGQDGVSFWRNGINTEFPIPDSVREFIQDFDAGIKVLPFSFELDVPEEYFNN